jgi:hypothetical protein
MGVCEVVLVHVCFKEGDPLVCQLVSVRSLLQSHAMTMH